MRWCAKCAQRDRLGPLVARFGGRTVSLPGGVRWRTDGPPTLMGLEALGAKDLRRARLTSEPRRRA